MKQTRIIHTILLTLLLAAAPCLAGEKPKVLIINSYHAEYPWVVAHNSALIKGLGDRVALSFTYLDSKRLTPIELKTKIAGAVALFKAMQPDLVILADDFALEILGRKFLAHKTPVVFLGINNNPREYIGDLPGITGVLERPLLKRSISYIQEILNGNMQKSLVLFDNSKTAQTTMEQIFKGNSSMVFNWTEVNIQTVGTIELWKETVLSAKRNGYNSLILGLYHTIRDDNSRHVDEEYIAKWTAENSPVPVFAFWDFAVGKDKAVGGYILSGEPQGREAARIANMVLDGRTPIDIPPVTAEKGKLIFSRSGLEKWNIKLPERFETSQEPILYVD